MSEFVQHGEEEIRGSFDMNPSRIVEDQGAKVLLSWPCKFEANPTAWLSISDARVGSNIQQLPRNIFNCCSQKFRSLFSIKGRRFDVNLTPIHQGYF
jgi:hypothetical protein